MWKKLSFLLCLFLCWVHTGTAQFINVSSPNGGETWQIGQGQSITWTSAITPGATVDIYLSYDNGQSYLPLFIGHPDIGFYSLTQVTGPVSSQCYVKIVESGNPSVADSSDAPFSIVPGQPLLELYYPNGGEIIPEGGTRNVLWSSANIDSLKIELSTNGGSTWSVLQTGVPASAGSAPITFPGPQNLTCKVRISDQNNASVNDESLSNFQIRTPFVLVSAPASNQILTWGEPFNILWSSAMVSDICDVEFSYDGVNFDTVALSQPNYGYYFWTVPAGTNSTTCRIRIRETNSTTVLGLSPPFTIQAPVPVINIQYPNGGESFIGTNVINVQFTSQYVTNGLIQYSADSMQTWLPIGSFVQGETILPWTLPGNVNSDDCFIRGIDSPSGNGDTSNAAFTISIPVPVVLMSTPLGTETWAIGSQQTISWASNYINQVKIEYSTDGGNTWNIIENSWNALATPYTWTVTGPVSQNAFIRVSDVSNASVFAQNQIPFSIVNPFLLISLPNGGESLGAGTSYNIQWQGSVPSGLINLDYSIDNGANWLNIVSSYTNNGGFVWTVPNSPSTTCLIRISDAGNPNLSDESNSVFTITPPVPEIYITAPLQNDVWSAGNSATTAWFSINVNLVNIYLSTDSGITFTAIGNNIPASQGFYDWTVVAASTNNAYVIVQDAQSSVADTSERFTIFSSVSGVLVTSPIGGETFPAGSTQIITWQSGSPQSVNIEYSFNNGQNWTLVASGVPANQNSYSWVVPPFIGSQYLIKVYYSGNPSISDVSGNFSVIPAFLSVTAPNGGEIISGITSYNIAWQGQGIASNVTLEYSSNNGLTWNTIVSNIPNSGLYSWLVPSLQSSTCRVRVRTNTIPALSDASNGAFTINAPPQLVRILSPNGAENLGAGQVVNIQFITNLVNFVKLEYTVNGGLNWATIVNVFPAQNGTYPWTIPAGINSNNVLLRISNAANITLSDVSDAPFTIGTPAITLITPNGGEILNPGASTFITWTGTGLSSFVKIEWSRDSMLTWQTIQPAAPQTGIFPFQIPNLPSNRVFFRVSDALNALVTDISNGPATIPGIPVGLQQVLAPNGSEQWVAGEDYLISWNFPQSSNLKIELSTNNGSSWSVLLPSVSAGAGNAQVSMPQTAANQCLIKITDLADPNINDISDQAFAIGTRNINLDNPPSSSLPAGSPMPLSWTSFGVSFVDLFFSSNGGNTWNVIDTNVYNQQAYIFVLPSLAGTNYRIKIAASDFPAVADSSTFFSLSTANSLSWLSPVQDLSVFPGSSVLLQWQGSGYPYAKLEYSNNGGSSWQNIIDSLSFSQGMFNWIAPGTPTNSGQFRITGFGSGSPQTITAPFTLTILSGAPSVTVLSPNGGEQLEAGAFVPVSWNHNNIALLDVFLSTNGGANYSQVNLVPAASGSFLWQVPNNPGNNIRLRLSANGIPAIQDASDANFSIVASSAAGQTITIDSVPDFSVCRGDSLYIPFSVSGSLNAGSALQVLISETGVNPPQPQLIKAFNYSGNPVDSVMAVIPAGISPGNYDVWISSLSPALISNPPLVPLEVKGFDIQVNASTTSPTLPGAPVSFSTSPGGTNYSYNWNFGSGSSTLAQPSFSYTQTGLFGLSLEMISSEGCRSEVNLPEFISVNYLFPNEAVPTQTDSSDFVSLTYLSQSQTWTAVAADGNLVISDEEDVWTNADLPPTAYLNIRTSALRGQEVIASGANGNTFYSQNAGFTWLPVSLQTAETVHDLNYASVNEGIACGTNGLVRRFNGSIWQNTSALTSAELFACYSGKGYQIVAGAGGTIRRGVLSNWDTIPSPLFVTWYDILMRDSLQGFLCGSNGTIAKTDNAGLSWQVLLTGVPVKLGKLWMSGDTLWAAGDRGLVMESVNAGSSWIRKSTGFGNHIRSMAYDRRKQIGYLVGDDGLFRRFGSDIYVPPPPPSGFEKLQGSTEFGMYPNPAAGIVKFSGLNPEVNYHFSIHSAEGKLIMHSVMRGDQIMQGLDTGFLNQGLFLINIGTTGWEARQRLVIIR